MNNIDNKTIPELLEIIEKAQATLEIKRHEKKNSIIAKIRELALSINVYVEITERNSDKKLTKVVAKYQNPNNPLQMWTGRGLIPKWMQEMIDQGSSKSDFLITK
ncbi:H-NS histone family protein [Methylomonas sp. AM2-LC]|uniref:H-NS histone family protein n=1 Tax=Methylomonas sp. AM2-LC TaxID=3153301 RepID=UPI003264DD54